ncbi:hypothetical protein DVH24_030765 [Malus domestica]|uniref:Uncharacterized protein n=1 Tax=Malus domestica TaxID=3750 RepID=A0A498HEZ0_MALDO|nr:hypothetical protein DVH24_030765 [Malus domestica]
MVVRERGMAETEVMELGVGIPQTEGCCQWVLISAISITGILSHEGFDQPTINNNVRRHQRFWTRNKD